MSALLGGGEVTDLRRLSGGASRETWSFDHGGRGLILRRDPPGAPRAGGMATEAALFEAAASAGVPVPALVHAGEWLVMERIDGETIPRKILRDEEYAAARPKLARQCGQVLAKLHSIPPASVPGLEAPDQLQQWRTTLDSLGQAQPVFEVAFKWLGDTRPASTTSAVVHGDFRNGNLIVGPDGVRSVLDWELAHLGDPMEDLGWLCATPWRFGVDLPVGGFGTYDDLVAGYESAGGGTVDRDALHWWEVLATLKWGVMCILQATTHVSGMIRSVELAAIGRRTCETEWDLLGLLGECSPPTHSYEDGSGGWPPHDMPSAAQLTEAVREFLERDVSAAVGGRVAFHTRVAVNVLGMVERELRIGPAIAADHARRLAELGVDSDVALAAGIRDGSIADDDRLRSHLVAITEAKLRVANPKYLDGPRPPA